MKDDVATNFLLRALTIGFPELSKITVLQKFDLEDLKSLYSPWDKETVEELATGEKISEHNWDKKLVKINYFKDVVINSDYTDTTIFVASKGNGFPRQIIDGIHRAIGIRKAINEDNSVFEKVNLRIIYIESDYMDKEKTDYTRLLD